MSKSLEQLLRERVEFDGWNPGELMGVGDIMNTGGKAENNRLKPLLDSLIKVAVAADVHVGRCEFAGRSIDAMEEALNGLREVVK